MLPALTPNVDAVLNWKNCVDENTDISLVYTDVGLFEHIRVRFMN